MPCHATLLQQETDAANSMAQSTAFRRGWARPTLDTRLQMFRHGLFGLMIPLVIGLPRWGHGVILFNSPPDRA